MKTDRRGFTLLEAVVALLIIGIAAITALEAVGGELRSHERVQRALEAESLADYQLAATQMLFYEDFVAFPDSLAHGRFAAPFDAYAWTTTVIPVVNEENLFQVDLEVTWQGGSYDLNTMVYRRPQTVAVGGPGGVSGGNELGRGGGNDRGGGGGNDRGGGGGDRGGGAGGGGGRGGGGGAARGGRGGGGGRGGAAAGPGRAGGTAGRGATTIGGIRTTPPPPTTPPPTTPPPTTPPPTTPPPTTPPPGSRGGGTAPPPGLVFAP